MAASSDKHDLMENLKKDLQELIKKRDEFEADIREFSDILDSEKGVGMNGPLIDEEDYPRSDIDVYLVRHTRHKIICLRNDHKALMKEIESKLYELHALEKERRLSEGEQMDCSSQGSTDTRQRPRKAFAVVDKVSPDSPAQAAGIEVGDGLVEFGSVTLENFESLQNVAAIVQHSVGKHVRVVVLRNGKEVVVTLEPKPWSGRGMLGCNIVPSKS